MIWSSALPSWRHQMETFSAFLAFVREIHRWPVNFPHKGQWRGALMFSLICAWINDWMNNREAGDLRRHCAHYDVIVMTVGTVDIKSGHGRMKNMNIQWIHSCYYLPPDLPYITDATQSFSYNRSRSVYSELLRHQKMFRMNRYCFINTLVRHKGSSSSSCHLPSLCQNSPNVSPHWQIDYAEFILRDSIIES